jgi:hypothetical protein
MQDCDTSSTRSGQIIVPGVSVSRAKALGVLINEKVRKLNGKISSKNSN